MTDVISARSLSNILNLIYEASLSPQEWDNVMDEFNELFSAHNTSIVIVDKKTGRPVYERTCGLTPEWAERLHNLSSQSYQMLVVTPAILDMPVAVMSRDAPPGYIAKLPLYENFARPLGIVDTMGLTVLNSAQRVVQVGLGRHARNGMFGPREIELAELLMPHLCRAFAISDCLGLGAVKGALMADAMDQLTAAVIIVDAQSRILHSNATADDLLSEGDLLRNVDGRLLAVNRGARLALSTSISALTSGDLTIHGAGHGIRLDEPPAPGPTVVAHILPLTASLRRHSLLGGTAMILVNRNVVGDVRGNDRIAAAFDLTGAESRVLEQLMAGLDPAGVALALGIGESTVRTHIRSLFAKTGTNRLSAMVAQIGTLRGAV